MVTSYVPGKLYTIMGNCSIDEDGVPPGNCHSQLLGLPVDRSSKLTVIGTQPKFGEP